jgi:ATP-dependent Clp protease ATP-binding subunit ClpC
LNRIDDLIVFNGLKKEHIFEIIDIELNKLFHRITDLGYHIKLTDEAKDFIAEKGYDEKFGARPLKRAIQKYLEDPLAEEIINSNIKMGDTLLVSFDKETETISMKVEKSKGSKKEEKTKDQGPTEE